MTSTVATTTDDRRDVDGFFDEHPGFVLGLELSLASCERFVHRAASLTHTLACIGFFRLIEFADLAIREGQRGIIPGMRDAGCLELFQGGGRFKSRHSGLNRLLDRSVISR